jgi:hypothetical protein
VHADPGARSGFIAAWLTNQLTDSTVDVSKKLNPIFCKIHKLDDVNIVKNFLGTKIRIRPEIESIDLHSLLFLRKNVYSQIPNFTRDEYSLETFTKIACFAREISEWDQVLDNNLYDFVLNFSDTFNNDLMIELYKKVIGIDPSSSMIVNLIETNKINNISINHNHACSILKLCLSQENKLNLKEQNRFWSIVDVYARTSVDKLYETVYDSIKLENYDPLACKV